jgi:hypothetical protein
MRKLFLFGDEDMPGEPEEGAAPSEGEETV